MLRKENKSVIFKALLNLQCPGLVLRNCVKYSRMFYVFVSRIVKLRANAATRWHFSELQSLPGLEPASFIAPM